jgi:phosphopantothenoylcysteine decarboxylase/phosphopantothenate--cysteine ligase
MFPGKTVILGVTGGIAVYKAVELLRLLTKAGAGVHVIMTKAAAEFVAPLTFQTLSGNPVHNELFNLISEQEISHISLADRADLFIIAPATANFVGKLANGIADDLLTTTVMATKAPVVIVPAMNVNMYDNPIYQENEARLKRHGYIFVEPATGWLACGWDGKGKLQEPAIILEEALCAVTRKDMKGLKVLVTAGPTREEIDPVRYITNHSSGRMGFAIARAARLRGATVTLISGPVSIAAPFGVELVNIETAAEMHHATLTHAIDSDIIIKAAAVADYKPFQRAGQKIKKNSAETSITMVKTADILADLGKIKHKGQTLVGFAAETENLGENAVAKLEAKNLDMIVANDVSAEGAGFNGETNIVRFIWRDGRSEELTLMTKEKVAGKLLDRVMELRLLA